MVVDADRVPLVEQAGDPPEDEGEHAGTQILHLVMDRLVDRNIEKVWLNLSSTVFRNCAKRSGTIIADLAAIFVF